MKYFCALRHAQKQAFRLTSLMTRVGQNHTYICIYGVYTIFKAGVISLPKIPGVISLPKIPGVISLPKTPGVISLPKIPGVISLWL
jgi:hypothetical protein